MARVKHHDRSEEDEEYGASSAHMRIKGLTVLLGSGAGLLAALVVSAYLAKHGYFPRRGGVPAMILIFIPLGFALVGFVELLTGYAIRQVIRKWDDLKGWQQGIVMILLAFSPFIFYSIGVTLF